MNSFLGINQLDTGQLSNFLFNIGVTGSVVRPTEISQFVTIDSQSAFEERVINIAMAGSGANFNTGQTLFSLVQSSGETLKSQIENSGLYIYNHFNDYNVSIESTGSYLRYLLTGLSGSFNLSGRFLDNKITGLSGSFNLSGRNLHNLITGLSGTFNITGLEYRRLLTGLSGQFNYTGRLIKDDISVIRNNLTKINLLSGSVALTGSGAANLYALGQTIVVNISDINEFGKLKTLNTITGNIFISGLSDISVSIINSGIYVSGASFLLRSETGIFANVAQTGTTLYNNDLLWSGTLISQNSLNRTGVFLLNSLSGNVIVTGGGLITNLTGEQTVILSGLFLDLPNWSTDSPDSFTGLQFFDDDFDDASLSSRWTGLNLSLDSSGMSNSNFWFYTRAANSSFQLRNFVQGCTTGRDWEISCKASAQLPTDNDHGFGLIMRNATSEDSLYVGTYYSTTYGFIGERWGSDSSFSATHFSMSGSALYDFDNIYLRLQCRNNACNFDYSNDGIVWRTIANFNNTAVANVNQVGLSAVTIRRQIPIAVDWFRATGLT